jgi:hypothetical protein
MGKSSCVTLWTVECPACRLRLSVEQAAIPWATTETAFIVPPHVISQGNGSEPPALCRGVGRHAIVTGRRLPDGRVEPLRPEDPA